MPHETKAFHVQERLRVVAAEDHRKATVLQDTEGGHSDGDG